MATPQVVKTPDVVRITLGILFIITLIAATGWILRPFLASIVWAAIIVVATWPVLLKFQTWFRGRRGPAVAAMVLILLLVVLIPLTAAIGAIIQKTEGLSSHMKQPVEFKLPQAPGWVCATPFLGNRICEKWQQYAALSSEELGALLIPYIRATINWFLKLAGSLAGMLFQFLLTVIISAIMYSGGEKAAAGILAFANRLAGQRGAEAAILAGKAVKSVALGIVVTAVIQTLISAIGLFICRVPAAALLTAVVFVLCLAQIGPFLGLFPVVIWLYWKGEPFLGTVLLVVMVIAGTVDNFIRPVLIKRGVNLPLAMIFAGVLGGLVAFGVVGLFIGPVVLAISYTLLKTWVSEADTKPGSDSTELAQSR